MSIEDQNERIRENMKGFDWVNATIDEMYEIFEDRDPLEFL